VSAVSVAASDRPGAGVNKDKQMLMNKAKTDYYCPVYVYPKRNDRYLIFRCYLKA
jgi:hypothetical protein